MSTHHKDVRHLLTCRQKQHTTIQEAQAVLRKGNAQDVLRVVKTLTTKDKDALSMWSLALRNHSQLSQQDMLRGCGCVFLALRDGQATQEEAVMVATVLQARKGGCACRCQPASQQEAQGRLRDGVAS